ncbi:MAG: hypothetical protein R3D88_01560 [Alphaproteobacteria bacterium]|nr:hypothetical protein [Alphaproteobacteria bacterium]
MKKLILLFVLLGVVGLIHPAKPMAQPQIAPQPCDTKYWEQMTSRAWMEAEREIMQNQNLIFKPDSVLEYTCFDQFVSINAHVAGPLFVHTNYFGTPIIPLSASQSMPNALANVVSTALNAYRNANFNDNFLGGRAGSMNIPNANSTFVSASTNVGYTCSTMAEVWRAAKCMNFIDNAAFQNTDGFYPFDDIQGFNGNPNVSGYAGAIQETRQWPASMSCSPSAGPGGGGSSAQNFGPAGTWRNQINIATNNNNSQYQFQAPLGTIYTDVGRRLRPLGSAIPGPGGNTSTCQAAIPTGITVYTQNGSQQGSHLDGVCTNPGCSYVRGGSATALGTCN